ncbi:MAG TPA: IS1595 family transposase [Bryobacteraceae bacterium]|nr:IS1595 family transposase [Bryobacteraceae bacterium]
MTLIDLTVQFSSEERCRELLERLRWPNGPICSRCGDSAVRLEGRTKLLYCKKCDYQFSVTTGTIFHDSHLPLIKWFTTTLLMCEAKKGISALQVKRTVGMAYKTAWYLCHRIRKAMNEANRELLNGTVEVDETFVGGKQRGQGQGIRDNKEVVIGIRQRGGELRFFHAADATSGTLARYIKENIDKDLDVIITDEWSAYPKAMMEAGVHGSRHKTIRHKDKIYVQGEIHTNTVESAFSLLKRGIIGTWHQMSAKHLAAYLEEMTFRFNRRNRSDLFLDTLRHMVTADPLTFEDLTA